MSADAHAVDARLRGRRTADVDDVGAEAAMQRTALVDAGMVEIWPADGDAQVRAWAKSAQPGAETFVGLYRLTLTMDASPTVVISGPHGVETTVSGARGTLAHRAVAWIEADRARVRVWAREGAA